MTRVWTNSSVLALAGDRDPIDVMTEKVRSLVLKTLEEGWSGPPFDPLKLANVLRLPIVAKDDLPDARTVPRQGGITIEYNPQRPKRRLYFSVAHEIAHTLFPDAAEKERYRVHVDGTTGDAWQLELLCNIGASEMLMPAGTLENLDQNRISIDQVIRLRETYAVSTEAVLRRVAKLSTQSFLVFAASRVDPMDSKSDFRIEYTDPSRAWSAKKLQTGKRVSSRALSQCTAIDFTSKEREKWFSLPETQIEALGIPPYPGHRLPRVAGMLIGENGAATSEVGRIAYVYGDATEPRGPGKKILVHLVNDKTPNWGGPFARSLKAKFPAAQQEFRRWAREHGLQLGGVQWTTISAELMIATIVGQKGYGEARKPRVRYGAVALGINEIWKLASKMEATVHMPRIGAGEAGGSWTVVSELIDEALSRRGVNVVVYTLPGKKFTEEPQQASLFSG